MSKYTVDHDTHSLWACIKGVPKKIKFRTHAVALAFAVTDYKLQAQTKDELILSIAPRPFPPHLDMKGFYTMESRVRAGDRLRVLHRPSQRKGGLDYLFKLKWQPELAAWNAGYDEAGDWDPTLRPPPKPTPAAKAKAAQAKRATAGPKAKPVGRTKAKARAKPLKRTMAEVDRGA